MYHRLLQFINAENISQSQFADNIGVARASISHILSGRNKPGFDFIEGMARHYPALNLEWLITGKGKMYKDMQDNLFSDSYDNNDDTGDEKKEIVQNTPASSDERSISKIVVFYDDNTFVELK